MWIFADPPSHDWDVSPKYAIFSNESIPFRSNIITNRIKDWIMASLTHLRLTPPLRATGVRWAWCPGAWGRCCRCWGVGTRVAWGLTGVPEVTGVLIPAARGVTGVPFPARGVAWAGVDTCPGVLDWGLQIMDWKWWIKDGYNGFTWSELGNLVSERLLGMLHLCWMMELKPI